MFFLLLSCRQMFLVSFNKTCTLTFYFSCCCFFSVFSSLFILVQPHRLIIDRKESESLIIFSISSLVFSSKTDKNKKKNLSLMVKRSIVTTNVYIVRKKLIFLVCPNIVSIMSFSFPQLT